MINWLLDNKNYTLFHHSNAIDLNAVMLMAPYVLSILVGRLFWWYHIATLIVVMMLIFRNKICKWRNIQLFSYWNSMAFVGECICDQRQSIIVRTLFLVR